MHHHTKHHHDPKLQERIAKQEKRDHRVEHVFRRILHFIERIVAAVTLVVLVAALGIDIYAHREIQCGSLPSRPGTVPSAMSARFYG